MRGRIGGMARHSFSAAVAAVVIVAWRGYGSEPKPVSIPLSSILSTSGQADLQAVTPAYRIVNGKHKYVVPAGEALEQFLQATKGQGASNAFLVDAPNDVSAIAASSAVFAGYSSANSPVALNQPNPPRGNHWLVVFTGVAGSAPVRWTVDSVTVDSGRVRFNYHKAPMGISTADIHYYYFWVPLGKLADGIYNLELHETNLKAVSLMRRVEVSKGPY